MKKKIIIMLAIMGYSFYVSGQSYNQLLTDPQGDNMMGIGPDIQTVQYAMDTVMDSIWFKIKTFNAITDSNDFGLEIGLDTDMNIHNGFAWDGNNTSMKCDQILFVMQDLIMPGFRYAALGQAGSPASFNVHVSHPDHFTWIVNAQLSKLDRDHKFNVVIGGASFDCAYTPGSVYDDAPNTGYKTISGQSGIPAIVAPLAIHAYPNPASHQLNISTDALLNGQTTIYNISGQIIRQFPIGQSKTVIPVDDLSAGPYLYQITDESGMYVTNGLFSVVH